MRIYVPATFSTLQELAENKSMPVRSGVAFAVTPALREYFTSGDDEELGYQAYLDAGRASLRLLSVGDEDRFPHRRVILTFEVDESTVAQRSGWTRRDYLPTILRPFISTSNRLKRIQRRRYASSTKLTWATMMRSISWLTARITISRGTTLRSCRWWFSFCRPCRRRVRALILGAVLRHLFNPMPPWLCGVGAS